MSHDRKGGCYIKPIHRETLAKETWRSWGARDLLESSRICGMLTDRPTASMACDTCCQTSCFWTTTRSESVLFEAFSFRSITSHPWTKALLCGWVLPELHLVAAKRSKSVGSFSFCEWNTGKRNKPEKTGSRPHWNTLETLCQVLRAWSPNTWGFV